MFEKNSFRVGLRNVPRWVAEDGIEAGPIDIENVREFQLPVKESLPQRKAVGGFRGAVLST